MRQPRNYFVAFAAYAAAKADRWAADASFSPFAFSGPTLKYVHVPMIL